MTVNSMKVGDVQEVVCESWFGAVDNLVDSDIDVPTMTMDVAGNSLTVVTTLTVKTADTPYILRGVSTAKCSQDESNAYTWHVFTLLMQFTLYDWCILHVTN